MRRHLPPLNAVKAFEAAARFGGYVAAAQELGVSPAAVSQQVKKLEQFFEKQLFVRHNNRLTLTDAGLTVFTDGSAALQRLAAMTERVVEGEVRTRLIVSVPPSLANRWLNQQIAGFLDREPSIRLDLRVEEDPVDFARYNIDVRICYGDHLYPDLASQQLIRDEVLPLMTPETHRKCNVDTGDPASLPDSALIHTGWGPSFASHPGWTDWFARAGVPRSPDAGRGHRVGMSSLALDLALADAGIALGQRLLAAADLATGRLVAPFAVSLPLGHPYCAVYPHAKSPKPGVQGFVAWLNDVTGDGR